MPKDANQKITLFRAKNIITLNNYRPWADHVAVRDGRILGVGTLRELEAWGEHTLDDRFCDKTITPGFVEGHGHMLEATMWKNVYAGYFSRLDPDNVRHEGVKSIDQVIDLLKRKDREMDDATAPLVAWCFDPIYYGGARMSREDLDGVSLTRPVVVLHASLHITNVNQAFIDHIGWQDETDVTGIKRYDDSSISGELHGSANQYGMVWAMTQGRDIENGLYNEWLAYNKIAIRAGATTLTDLGAGLGLEMIKKIAEFSLRDEASMRLVPTLLATAIPTDDGLARLNAVKDFGTDKLKLGIVKLVVDGSIQGFTGRLRWPGYANGSTNGIWNVEPSDLPRRLGTYHDAGFQVHIHTNGDEATEVTLNALEEVLSKNPRPDHRHTLQHCQMADEAQFQRMKAMGVCVNLFSNHLYYWGDQHKTQTMGPDRAMRMNAAGTASRLGLAFAIHSDSPITPLAPLFTAWCAVNRQTSAGEILGPEECISVEEALRAITIGPAYTLKMDGEIGSIDAGKWADFAILDANPYEVDPTDLKDISVHGTVVGGQVFEA
jgi:predicted amidohydrolase YtcJ